MEWISGNVFICRWVAARVSAPISRVQAIDDRGSDTAEAALRCSSMQG